MTYTVRYGPSGDIAEISVRLPDGTQVTIAEDQIVRVWAAGAHPLGIVVARDGPASIRTVHPVPGLPDDPAYVR